MSLSFTCPPRPVSFLHVSHPSNMLPLLLSYLSYMMPLIVSYPSYSLSLYAISFLSHIPFLHAVSPRLRSLQHAASPHSCLLFPSYTQSLLVSDPSNPSNMVSLIASCTPPTRSLF